jgi:hypothetical protein
MPVFASLCADGAEGLTFPCLVSRALFAALVNFPIAVVVHLVTADLILNNWRSITAGPDPICADLVPAVAAHEAGRILSRVALGPFTNPINASLILCTAIRTICWNTAVSAGKASQALRAFVRALAGELVCRGAETIKAELHGTSAFRLRDAFHQVFTLIATTAPANNQCAHH